MTKEHVEEAKRARDVIEAALLEGASICNIFQWALRDEVIRLREALTAAERELEAERVRTLELSKELRDKAEGLEVLRETPMHKLLSKMKTELEDERGRHRETNLALVKVIFDATKMGDSLRSELADARKECEEQARLNGMGGEREAKLRSENDALQADNTRLASELGKEKSEVVELIKAVADHVTVRGEYFARIKDLEGKLHDKHRINESQREEISALTGAIAVQRQTLEARISALEASTSVVIHGPDGKLRGRKRMGAK